jgi:hypothetical protein
MAQGAIKSKKASIVSKDKRPTVLGPKKGARTIAPKKAVLVKNAKMTKVLQDLKLDATHWLTSSRNIQQVLQP